ncbi:ABC transporter substrate-binding protein [Pseudomonas sp. MH2]|uniref:ABC transporter substrate-binding protein n=1 Tax=Pseudomonas machongensis TaxID=3110229 RepID=A0ABU5VBF8_9PSED|nr:ABC transporter substrate-binding protein [Pseudomonas sp. MH2]MEA5670701.1 ABC transporter substrate-binding protein [Pseudomonas sp. MH2]
MFKRLLKTALLAGTALCVLATSAAETTKVRLAFPSEGFLYVPIYVAQRSGYFADEDLDVETIVFQKGGSAALTAVLGRDADIYVGLPAVAIRARSKGQKVQAFASVQTQFGTTVVIDQASANAAGVTAASPVADRARALKGLKIGVTGPGSTTDMLVRYLAKDAGLRPDQDMTLMPVGGAPNMLAAFSQGSINGFSLSPPTVTTAAQQGGFVLMDLAKGEYPPLDGFLFTAMIAREDWLSGNADTARKMVRALWRAEQLIANAPDQAREAVRPYFAHTSATIFDAAWAASLPSYPATPAVERAGIDKNIHFMNAVEAEPVSVDPQSVFTNAIVEAVAPELSQARGAQQ